jgi:undecaprenyl diphosphate synthase
VPTASTPTASPPTSPASWTATAGGPSQRGLKRTEGHAAGEEALFDTVEGALELGIKWLTVYAFSTENWKRPADEVRYLMGFNESSWCAGATSCTSGACACGSSVGVTGGSRSGSSGGWTRPSSSPRNRTMTLTIAFNYGGRAEIVDAVRALVAEGAPRPTRSTSGPSDHLYDPEMPDPDLMVRTSGEYRISNFLLWELAYSELVFTEVLWPDFRREHLFDAVREYQRRDRRFGGVDDG